MISCQDYRVADPDALETPAMLLFQDLMDHNIRSVCELVGGGENLIAHVKTHKSLKELEMVLQAGASKAILSYPQCQEIKIERFCDLTMSYPDAWIAAIVSSQFHLNVLDAVATRREQSLRVMMDLDAGMHRTGIGFGPDATKLYQDIDAHPYLQASGFHLYDGHERGGGAAAHRVAAGISARDRVGGDARSVCGRRRQLVISLLRAYTGHVRITGDFYLLGRGLSHRYARHAVSLCCPDPNPGSGPVSGHRNDHYGPGVQGDQFGSSARGKSFPAWP
jgi:hypothetical protein